MATAKQVVANRAPTPHAAPVPGPPRAGQNPAGTHSVTACRYRLASPRLAKSAGWRRTIAGENPSEQRLMAASEFATAHCELMRIRALRCAPRRGFRQPSTQGHCAGC
jgi:hypothetical protein